MLAWPGGGCAAVQGASSSLAPVPPTVPDANGAVHDRLGRASGWRKSGVYVGEGVGEEGR
jgi:hypothetical protein